MWCSEQGHLGGPGRLGGGGGSAAQASVSTPRVLVWSCPARWGSSGRPEGPASSCLGGPQVSEGVLVCPVRAAGVRLGRLAQHTCSRTSGGQRGRPDSETRPSVRPAASVPSRCPGDTEVTCGGQGVGPDSETWPSVSPAATCDARGHRSRSAARGELPDAAAHPAKDDMAGVGAPSREESRTRERGSRRPVVCPTLMKSSHFCHETAPLSDPR